MTGHHISEPLWILPLKLHSSIPDTWHLSVLYEASGYFPGTENLSSSISFLSQRSFWYHHWLYFANQNGYFISKFSIELNVSIHPLLLHLLSPTLCTFNKISMKNRIGIWLPDFMDMHLFRDGKWLQLWKKQYQLKMVLLSS